MGTIYLEIKNKLRKTGKMKEYFFDKISGKVWVIDGQVRLRLASKEELLYQILLELKK